MARGHAQVLLEVLRGEGFAQPNPRPMFPNPPGVLRTEPHSPGLDYNTHVIDSILTHVAPALGWR